jgi:predicted esterase
MTKLRILALHGYHGSGAVLREQMRAFADGLEDVADFVRVDAPSLAAGDFGWWHTIEEVHDGARRGRCRGWERTRDSLLARCAQDGPFDGVFGFSQGAALAALLVGLCARDGGARPGFALMAGGFVTRDAAHAPLYAALAQPPVPSLHLIGRGDGIVPAGASRELASRFVAPLVLEHDGGHVVAASPAIRCAARGFLEDMAQRRARTLEVPLWRGRAHIPDGKAGAP